MNAILTRPNRAAGLLSLNHVEPQEWPEPVAGSKDVVVEIAAIDDRRLSSLVDLKLVTWSSEENALYWVDIVARRIHRLEPARGRHEIWSTADFVTSIGMWVDGGFIVGLCRNVCLWQPGVVFEKFVVPEPDLKNNRLNKGRVAPDVAFWVSTMQSNHHPDGSLKDIDRNVGAIHHIDAGGHVARLTPNEYGITNTMVWTQDGRFFFADTLANEIYLFDYDAASGTLANRRTIASGFSRGLPAVGRDLAEPKFGAPIQNVSVSEKA